MEELRFKPVFKAVNKPRKQENAPGSINVCQPKKPTKKAVSDGLFEDDRTPEEIEKISEVVGLMANHSKILSMTRPSGNVWQETFKKLNQIDAGTLMYAYDWDKAFLTKNPNLLDGFQMKWDDLIAKIDSVLAYVEEKQQYGYWYPGKNKASLSSFLVSEMRSGGHWSPFLEIMYKDCITPRQLRKTIGEGVCKILDEILDKANFPMTFENLVLFYKGVLKLRSWYEENKETLVKQDAYLLANFSALCKMVQTAHEKRNLVWLNFTNPEASNWGAFKDFAKKYYNVNL